MAPKKQAQFSDVMDNEQDPSYVPMVAGLFFTPKGLQRFGQLVVNARQRFDYIRQDHLSDDIYKKTGYKLSEGTISNIERGRLASKQADLISAIAHLEIIRDYKDDRPYTAFELEEICREKLYPFPTEVKKTTQSRVSRSAN
jgi:hypothetical protein